MIEEYENFIHNKYGYCYYSLKENEPAIIFNLYVEPEYRRQGHARKLINYVIKEIMKTGYKNDILIKAEPRENSISVEDLIVFYEEMGLKIKELNNE
jgi:GNAT superfamily N-acetyltransferase